MKMELPWCTDEEFSSYGVFISNGKGEVDLENTFYKMCIIFMETFTKATVVHHGLRQLNKVKYPTNQEEYRLLIDSSNKF